MIYGASDLVRRLPGFLASTRFDLAPFSDLHN